MANCFKVPIYNVSPVDSPNVKDKSVQTVLGDYSLVQSYENNRNIDLSKLFISPNIVPRYIDPEWCEGDDDAERFDELSIDDPISCYDYIQYGGCEEAIPEIYFSNIIDRRSSDHAAHYVDSDTVLNIYMIPDELAIKAYYSESVPTSQDSPTGYFREVLYRDTEEPQLGDNSLRVKVGVDNLGGAASSITFNIKITGYLAGERVEENKFNFNDTEGNKWLLPVLIGSAPVAALGTNAAIQAAAAGGQYLDYLVGPNSPVYKAFTKVSDAAVATSESSVAGALLVELSIILAVILVIDRIWKIFGADASIEYPDHIDGAYKLTTGGLYNRFDVRESTVDFKVGNPSSNVYSTNETYTIKDEVFTSANYNITIPADKFPSNNNDYIVLDFTAIGNQFDAITPLPGVFFVVELQAVSGCVLSETKHVVFTTTIFPDKITPPGFDIQPRTIYKNSSVTLFNALYCDYVAGRDMTPDYLFNWEIFGGGLFPYFYNFCINGNSNEGGAFDFYSDYTGVNVLGTGDSVFHISPTIEENYEGLFMLEQERYSQSIWNYTFINRNDNFNEQYQDVITYWNFDTDDWQIRGGGLRRVGTGTTEVYQEDVIQRSVNWPGMYYIDINIQDNTGGAFYINCDNTFDGQLYNAKSNDLTNPNVTTVSGVSRGDNKIYFNTNGNFKIVLKALQSVTGRFTIGSDVGFNGYITHLKAHRMHPKDDSVKRGLTLARIPITLINDYNWIDNHIKLYHWYDDRRRKRLDITLRLEPIGAITRIFKVCWQWDESKGTTDKERLANNTWESITVYAGLMPVTTFTHEYVVPNVMREVRVMATDPTNPLGYTNIPYLEVHSTDVYAMKSDTNILHGATVDLSGCNIGAAPFETLQDYTSFNNIANLDISYNTKLNVETLYLYGITNKLIAHHTLIYGDLGNIYAKDTIELHNTNVNYYSSNKAIYCKNIKWYDITHPMSVFSLDKLVRDLWESTIMNGTLYIYGTNPDITDAQVLWWIFQLAHERDWIVMYNGYYVTTGDEGNYLTGLNDYYIYTTN